MKSEKSSSTTNLASICVAVVASNWPGLTSVLNGVLPQYVEGLWAIATHAAHNSAHKNVSFFISIFFVRCDFTCKGTKKI